MINAFSTSDSDPRRRKAVDSDREKEIVQLVAQGFRNREIGEYLGISEVTVKVHVKRIMDKLRAKDRTEAIAIAIRRGIIRL